MKEFNCFLWCNCCVPLLWWNGSVFIRGNSGYFPYWMEIRYLSHWVRSFIFLIIYRLLRDNVGVVIMHDLSFLIHGVRIMEIEHFSFYMSFWGRLYHLITWQGGFNSRPGPIYFGMDRNSQWAKLLYRICALTLFIRRRLGPVFLGLCFRPLQVWFSTPSVAP